MKQDNLLDNLPKNLREIARYRDIAHPILISTGILSTNDTYFKMVVKLINRLSETLNLPSTLRYRALADCIGREGGERMAENYLRSPDKHPMKDIPYGFFTHAITLRKINLEKKGKDEAFVESYLSKATPHAKLGDSIIAAYAAACDIPSRKNHSIKNDCLSRLITAHHLDTLPTADFQKLLQDETDFYTMWEKRNLLYNLDQNDLKVWEALLTLTDVALEQLKQQLLFTINIDQMESLICNKNKRYQNWYALSQQLEYTRDHPSKCKLFYTVSTGLKEAGILSIAAYSDILLSALTYRITPACTSLFGIFDSVLTSEQKEHFGQYVLKATKDNVNLRLPRVAERWFEKKNILIPNREALRSFSLQQQQQ